MSNNDLSHIESTIAHLEKQVTELSDVAFHQDKEIEKLKLMVKRLHGKIEEIEETASSASEGKLSVAEQATRDKPPHY